MTSPKDYSRMTLSLLQGLVPIGTPISVEESTMTLDVNGIPGTVRVKRAKGSANQVQVWRGEPILVHLPKDDADDTSADEWVLMSVPWQIRYAQANPERRQHAVNSFDCMQVSTADLKALKRVVNIVQECTSAVTEARRPEVQFVTRGLRNLQNAVANALVQTYQELTSAVSEVGEE